LADDPAILTPPRSVAFDAVAGIRSGMDGFRRAWPILFVGGCIKGCTEGGATGNPGGATQLGDAGSGGAMPRWDWDPRTLGITAAVAVVVVVLIVVVVAVVYALRAWFIPGWLRVHEQVLRTGATDWSVLFSGADRFVPMLVWSLLRSFIGVGALMLPAVPGLALAYWAYANHQSALGLFGVALAVLLAVPVGVYVGLGLVFGEYLVVFDQRSAVDALEESWAMARGQRLQIVVFGVTLWFARMIATLAGFCLLCVGSLVTSPIALAIHDYAWTRAFLLLTRPREETDAWLERA
jgi:hypothetical protein